MKQNHFIFIILLAFLYLYPTFHVDATTHERDLGVVDAHHDFTIQFSNPVDVSTLHAITVSNILGETIPVQKLVSADAKKVIIQAPEDGYNAGVSYFIQVTQSLKSTNGKPLRTNTSAHFSTLLPDQVLVEGVFKSLGAGGNTLLIETANGTVKEVPFVEEEAEHLYLLDDRDILFEANSFKELLTYFEKVKVTYEETAGMHYYAMQPLKYSGYFGGFVYGWDEIALGQGIETESFDFSLPANGTYKITIGGGNEQLVTKDTFVNYLAATEDEIAIDYEVVNGRATFTTNLTRYEATLNRFTSAGMTLRSEDEQLELTLPMPSSATYLLEVEGLNTFKLSKEAILSLADTLLENTNVLYEKIGSSTTITFQTNSIAGSLASISTNATKMTLLIENANEELSLPLTEDIEYAIAMPSSESYSVTKEAFTSLLSEEQVGATITYTNVNGQITYTAMLTKVKALFSGLLFDDNEAISEVEVMAPTSEEYFYLPAQQLTHFNIQLGELTSFALTKEEFFQLYEAWADPHHVFYEHKAGKTHITISFNYLKGQVFNAPTSDETLATFDLQIDTIQKVVQLPLHDSIEYMVQFPEREAYSVFRETFTENLHVHSQVLEFSYELVNEQAIYTAHMSSYEGNLEAFSLGSADLQEITDFVVTIGDSPYSLEIPMPEDATYLIRAGGLPAFSLDKEATYQLLNQSNSAAHIAYDYDGQTTVSIYIDTFEGTFAGFDVDSNDNYTHLNLLAGNAETLVTIELDATVKYAVKEGTMKPTEITQQEFVDLMEVNSDVIIRYSYDAETSNHYFTVELN